MNIDLLYFSVQGRRVDKIEYDGENFKLTFDMYGYGKGPTLKDACDDFIRREEEERERLAR